MEETTLDESLREEAEIEAKIAEEQAENELYPFLSPEEVCITEGHDLDINDSSGDVDGRVDELCKRCGKKF